MTSGAHGEILDSNIIVLRWHKSLLRQTAVVEDERAGVQGFREINLRVFEIDERCLIYT